MSEFAKGAYFGACIILLTLTGCAGSFAWEDVHHSTHEERVNAAQRQEALVEQQLNHQLKDGSISQADYDKIIKADRDYANSIQ